jgi:hypothetical protein
MIDIYDEFLNWFIFKNIITMKDLDLKIKFVYYSIIRNKNKG